MFQPFWFFKFSHTCSGISMHARPHTHVCDIYTLTNKEKYTNPVVSASSFLPFLCGTMWFSLTLSRPHLIVGGHPERCADRNFSVLFYFTFV